MKLKYEAAAVKLEKYRNIALPPRRLPLKSDGSSSPGNMGSTTRRGNVVVMQVHVQATTNNAAPTLNPKASRSPTHDVKDSTLPVKTPDFSRKFYRPKEIAADGGKVDGTVAPVTKPPKRLSQYIPQQMPLLRVSKPTDKRMAFHKGKEPTPSYKGYLPQPGPQDFEAVKLDLYRSHELLLKRCRAPSHKEKASTSQGAHLEDLASTSQEIKGKEYTTEALGQLNDSLHQRINAMKLRRNARHGIALYRKDNKIDSEFSLPMCKEEISETDPSVFQIREEQPTVDESPGSKLSSYQKIEALKLKRKSRCGIALYRLGDMDSDISPTHEIGDFFEVASIIEVMNENLKADDF